MKLILFAFLAAVALVSPGFSQNEILSSVRDFRPEDHFENIPGADASVLQCYVFQTTPGIGYQVETSNDLVNWTTNDELYGLGHEYVVTMREFTPAPPPDPGAPPSTPPSAPTKCASIRMQPASGTAGGTVVAWPSLDNGGPVMVKIDGALDAGWASVPLYARGFGDYEFFVWHPTESIEPPATNPPLGPEDTAMLAALEEHLPAMNIEVATSAARSRNAPPPAPTDPDSLRFWRIKVDAGIDTDTDGTPDWSEFEMAANSTGGMVAGVTGDAFNADTNNDCIPDGLQIDSDGDGTPDAKDPAVSDNTASFPIGPLPRYAVFPITNTPLQPTFPAPFQINDKGTVVYETGTWAGGVWTPLNPLVGDETYSRAYAINDNDVILGIGSKILSEDPYEYYQGICFWSAPQGIPSFVSTDDGKDAMYGYNFAYGYLAPGPALSNDGYFTAPTYGFEGGVYKELHIGFWKLPSGNQPVSEQVGDGDLEWTHDNGLRWGYKPQLDSNGNEDWALPVKGIVSTPGLLPELPFIPVNVLSYPGSPLIALPGFYELSQGMAYVNGGWKVSAAYANAIDISADGTAIGRTGVGKIAPIYLNGNWTDIQRTAPDVPGPWKDVTVTLWDTTPGGWILARRGDYLSPGNAVMLPIRIAGVPPAPSFAEATGVDAHSVGCPAPGDAVQDRIWIMAPAGTGASQVVLKSPLNANTPLKLTGPGIKFGNEDSITLSGATNSFQIKADNPAASGQDIPLKVELGSVESLSKPLGVKIMKARTVKVTIHPVVSIGGGRVSNGPDLVSNKPAVENYLNQIYGPQINANFVVTVDEPSELDWDNATSSDYGYDPFHYVEPGNGHLDFMGDQSRKEEDTIDNGLKDANANINIYILGRGKINPMINWEGELKRPDPWGAYGFARRERNMIFIDGDIGWFNSLTNRDSAAEQLHTIAHEIGHCIVGDGHPNQGGGKAPLKGLLPVNAVSERLMVSGDKFRRPNFGCRLVKGEWDEAEKWLKNYIDK